MTLDPGSAHAYAPITDGGVVQGRAVASWAGDALDLVLVLVVVEGLAGPEGPGVADAHVGAAVVAGYLRDVAAQVVEGGRVLGPGVVVGGVVGHGSDVVVGVVELLDEPVAESGGLWPVISG